MDKNKIVLFEDITQVYNASGRYEVQSFCNALLFTNIGADAVTVNGKLLLPGVVGTSLGDAFGLGGNEYEVYAKKEITVIFATVVNPLLEVTQKYFKV